MSPQEHTDQRDRVKASLLVDHARITLHDVYPRRGPHAQTVPGGALAAAVTHIATRPLGEVRP